MTESRKQTLDGLIVILSVAMCLFQMYTSAVMPLQAMQQRSIFLGFGLLLAFLHEAKKHEHSTPIRVLCYAGAALSVMSAAYVTINWLEMQNRTTRLVPADYAFAVLMVVIILYLTWRYIGIWMPLIALAFLAYAFAGPYLTGLLRVSGMSLQRITACLYCGTEGIFGTCLGATATYVFMFVVLGEFLVRYGAGDFFIKLAEIAFGRVRGGTGKIAVITCALFGMISGSPTANVAATGCLTIPMMKKSGYSAEYSGGVVSAAAAGGSIMPPVMGAGAFVMAEIIGVTYKSICIAAVFPALLYFLSLFLMVDINAVKNGLSGKKCTDELNWKELIREGWHYMLCILTLMMLLIVLSFSPAKSAFASIVVLLVTDALKECRRHRAFDFRKLVGTLAAACKSAIPIITATACAGIIIGAFTATGLNLRLSSVLIELSGGNLLLLLVFASVGALILGMGLPATPVYILMAVMIAPALTRMGIPKLPAHMFVFYFGAMAPITPPVGTAFFVAAGLAKSSPMRTGFVAWYIALVAFLLPFLWIYQPAFLLDGPVLTVLWTVATALMGTAALAFGLEGYLMGRLNPALRIILIVAAIIVIIPETVSTVIGAVMLAAVAVWQRAHAAAKG